MKNHKMYVALGGKGCLIERCHICQNADLGKCTIDLDTNADDCMFYKERKDQDAVDTIKTIVQLFGTPSREANSVSEK